MIVRPKLALRRKLAGQHPGRQWEPGQNPDLALARFAEKQVRRTLAKDIENDLYRLHTRVFNRLQRLLDLFNADAVMANLSLPDQIVKSRKQFRPIVNLGRRAMQLQQVERLDFQVLKASFDEGRQVL